MKVMFIIHTYKFDGSTISFLNLVEGLRKYNIEVVVVYPKINDNDMQLINKLTNIGCRCIEAKVATSFNYLREGMINYIKFIFRFILILYRKIIFYKQLKKIVINEKPDIIHSNTGVIHEGYLIAKKYKKPHVWHLREYQEKDFKMFIFPSKYIFKKMLNKSYTIPITKDIQQYFNLENNNKSFVIYNPIMSFNKTKDRSEKSNYFIVTNKLSKEKGIEDIIEAFSIFLFNYPNYKLLILGFGNEKYVEKLKEKTNSYNILANVDFLGYKEDVYTYIKKAKALIVGSYYEGFGRMTAEANMLGIPVIGRNTGGTKEILENTKGGFLFDTVEQMASYMKKIASKSDLEIQELMKEPQKTAIESFSNEQHIEKVINLYKSIINQN